MTLVARKTRRVHFTGGVSCFHSYHGACEREKNASLARPPRFHRRGSGGGHGDGSRSAGCAEVPRRRRPLCDRESAVDFRRRAGADWICPRRALDELSAFLTARHASIVGGPRGGLYKVRFGDKALSKDEMDALIRELRATPLVTFALPAGG